MCTVHNVSSETEGPRPDDLCGLMLNGKIHTVQDVQDFLTAKNSTVEDTDQCGRTPLMVACAQRKKDIILFLLSEGADPNRLCTDHSTPLHYACRPMDYRGDGVEQLPIIEMLAKHGAKMTPDIHGWTPVCYAALHNMSEVVEHFLSNSHGELSQFYKTLALEILSFARSVFGVDHSKAYEAIHRALQIREEAGTPVTSSFDSVELEACLRTHECKTPGELSSMGAGDEGQNYLKKQGFLIGLRVLPDALKEICFWPIVALFNNHDSPQSHLRTCGFILKLETQSRVAIGTALKGIASLLDPVGFPSQTRLPSDFNLYHSLLELYRDILPKARFQHAPNEAKTIQKALINILAGVVGNLYANESCLAIIRTVTDIVGLLYKSTDYTFRFPSVLSALVDLYQEFPGTECRLNEDIKPNNYQNEKENVMKMLQLACILLVKHEYPTLPQTTDDDEGGLLVDVLHDLFFEMDMWLEVTTPVVRQFLRFGCPVKPILDFALHHKEFLLTMAPTPELVFAQYKPEYLQNCEELLDLLKKEKEAVQPLQELVIRVVLKNRIQYHGIVPRPICDIIDGVIGI